MILNGNSPLSYLSFDFSIRGKTKAMFKVPRCDDFDKVQILPHEKRSCVAVLCSPPKGRNLRSE